MWFSYSLLLPVPAVSQFFQPFHRADLNLPICKMEPWSPSLSWRLAHADTPRGPEVAVRTLLAFFRTFFALRVRTSLGLPLGWNYT